MARRAIRRAAEAQRASVERVVHRERRRHDYATVRGLDPVRAELHHSGWTVTDGEDLRLGQWVRRYDDKWMIDVGDTLYVTLGPDDDWVALEVLGDKEMED